MLLGLLLLHLLRQESLLLHLLRQKLLLLLLHWLLLRLLLRLPSPVPFLHLLYTILYFFSFRLGFFFYFHGLLF